MESSIKVSVIELVYKAEEYRRKSVYSILAQPLENFEVIIFDDGSADSSGSVNATKDIKIKVIQKSKAGVIQLYMLVLTLLNVSLLFILTLTIRLNLTCLKCLYEKAHENNADIVICNSIIGYLGKHLQKSQLLDNDVQIDL